MNQTKDKKVNVAAIDEVEEDNSVNKMSIQERQHLLSKGLCFFCKKPGHLVKDCPNRAQTKKSTETTPRKVCQLEAEDKTLDTGEEADDEDDELQVDAVQARIYELNDDSEDF